ncbi:TolC family protein [Leptospira stimsonii]|uniref:Transporter n=1 Tax=Leptospira stimsonii TaxID=2202203 RepID=A0ABY2MVD6_9LEPT|nr:TolC family protein [Leptospira stimsonii]TGK13297.1 transporter [Leptospira stimsonii]TGM09074.1 transporter [Leptospira stimsonii]
MSSLKIYYTILIYFFSFSIFAEGKDVRSILELVAKEHPEAKSLGHLTHAHQSHSDATGILPDPKIGVAYRNFPTRNGYSLNDRPLDTPTMTGVEFSLSQEFPFPGKLGSEQKISIYMEKEAGFRYLSGINRLLGDFLSKLNRFQRLQNKKELNSKILQILSSQKNISESYYSSGNVSLAGSIKASIAKTESFEKETEYNTNLKDLFSQLSYFRIQDKLSFEDFSSLDLDRYFKENESKILSFANSFESAARANPDYRSFLTEEKRLKESAKLSKLSLLPQTEVFVSYMNRRNQNFSIDRGPLDYRIMDTTEYRGDLFSFGINMRIPVWSALKWESITGQYEREADAGKESAEKVKMQVISDLNRNFELIRGYETQIEIIQRKLIPELERAVRANASLYVPGKASPLDILSTQVEVIQARIRKEDLIERKNESFINILQILSQIHPNPDDGTHFGHVEEGGRL